SPDVKSISKFLEINPLALVKRKNFEGQNYIYGKIINSGFIDDIAQRINAEVAVIWENSAAELSNPTVNREYLYLINTAYNYLKNKNSFEIYTQGTKASDILATLYKTNADDVIKTNLSFLIFNKMGEAATLRDTLKNVLFIIGFVGIIISLILSYLLTNKIRRQIGELSSATEDIRSGNFSTRVSVKGKDEVAKLGDAFNLMLDEIVKNQKAMNDYTEFITLINQNPSLTEISEAALKKIIKTCGFTIGAIYSVDDQEVSFITSFGLGSNNIGAENNIFYKKVIETKEPITIESENFLPVASTGILEIKIKYLHIRPVIYSNKVIAVLEFGSLNKPTDEAINYLSKIQDQLAIGLTNAKAFVQLENFVKELSRLNEEMQKQNEQIKEQNKTLLELSEQLKEKAKELGRLILKFILSDIRRYQNAIKEAKVAQKIVVDSSRGWSIIVGTSDNPKFPVAAMKLRPVMVVQGKTSGHVEIYFNKNLLPTDLIATISKDLIGMLKNREISLAPPKEMPPPWNLKKGQPVILNPRGRTPTRISLKEIIKFARHVLRHYAV
ncbi:MAG: HAMP domain-containing protein, partial [Ignavibacterium sp.]